MTGLFFVCRPGAECCDTIERFTPRGDRLFPLSGMSKSTQGWLFGFIGMLIFSASMPATKAAVADLDPYFVTVARAAIAGCLGSLALLALNQQWPSRQQLVPLFITSVGVVVGFPLLSALALKFISAAHSAVFLGLLPISTAFFAVMRAGERPRPAFWLFCLTGSGILAGFSLIRDSGGSLTGDVLMLAAVGICGLGYAEGGKLSRVMGGWQVICWALVLALPIMLPLTYVLAPVSFANVGAGAWLGLAYVCLFSMLIGFFFWYRGLALGGIALVGQLQLLQPFFALALAALLLGETVQAGMVVTAAIVALCVAGARKTA